MTVNSVNLKKFFDFCRWHNLTVLFNEEHKLYTAGFEGTMSFWIDIIGEKVNYYKGVDWAKYSATWKDFKQEFNLQ